MAALNRPTEATYVINEKVTVDTTDREDHTFCGIMFPIKCKDVLPVTQVVVNNISVRGGLGPITVWVTNDTFNTTSQSVTEATPAHDPRNVASTAGKRRSSAVTSSVGNHKQTGMISLKLQHWTNIYSQSHAPSYRHYTNLDISANPIVLKPNQVRGIYIHSTLDGDEAIVYDNKHRERTHDDSFITVLPGRAHVSSEPFGSSPPWGYGSAWRDNREFVGRISYGVVYRLWNPTEYKHFGGGNFRKIVRTLFACQRRFESPISRLPDDVIYYIMNMCRWDWLDDGYGDCLEHKKNCRRENRRISVKILKGGEEESTAALSCAASTGSGRPTCDGDKSSGKQRSTSVSDEVNDMDADDSEIVNSDDDESDSDMENVYVHNDHTSSTTFSFRNVDDCASSDEEGNAESERRRRAEEQRRRLLRRNHRFLFQHLGGLRAQFMTTSDGDDGNNGSDSA